MPTFWTDVVSRRFVAKRELVLAADAGDYSTTGRLVNYQIVYICDCDWPL